MLYFYASQPASWSGLKLGIAVAPSMASSCLNRSRGSGSSLWQINRQYRYRTIRGSECGYCSGGIGFGSVLVTCLPCQPQSWLLTFAFLLPDRSLDQLSHSSPTSTTGLSRDGAALDRSIGTHHLNSADSHPTPKMHTKPWRFGFLLSNFWWFRRG